jgi:hypothetical protein
MESPPQKGELLTLANAHKRLVMDLPTGTAPAYITLRKHAASGRLDKIAVERPGKWTIYPYGALLAMYAPSSANPRSNTPRDSTQEEAAIKRAPGPRESTDRHPEQGNQRVEQPSALTSLSIEEITQRVAAELVPVLERTIAAQISRAFESSLGDVIERLESVAGDAKNLEATRRVLMVKADEAEQARRLQAGGGLYSSRPTPGGSGDSEIQLARIQRDLAEIKQTLADLRR